MYELEERHGVDLGVGYKNDHACSTFTSFIAREQQQLLVNATRFLAFKLMLVVMLEMWSLSYT